MHREVIHDTIHVYNRWTKILCIQRLRLKKDDTKFDPSWYILESGQITKGTYKIELTTNYDSPLCDEQCDQIKITKCL